MHVKRVDCLYNSINQLPLFTNLTTPTFSQCAKKIIFVYQPFVLGSSRKSIKKNLFFLAKRSVNNSLHLLMRAKFWAKRKFRKSKIILTM